MSGKFIVELTRSQQMALIDALVEHLSNPNDDRTVIFLDCSVHPAIQTTVSDLISIVSHADFIPEEKEKSE